MALTYMRIAAPLVIPLLLGFGASLAAPAAAEEDPLAVLDERAGADAPDPAGAVRADPLEVLDGGTDEPAARSPAPPVSVDMVEAAHRLWQRGEIDEALVALKVILRGDLFHQDALLLLAELQLARMQGAAAEATLRRALDARAPRERVLVPLAKALNLQGRQRELLDEVTPAADLDAATRGRLLAEHARAWIALGDDAAAAAAVDAAMAAAPAIAEPHVGRAVLALRGGFPDQARDALDQALRKDPDHHDAWALLGELEQGAGNLPAAEAAFGEAIARSPNRWLAAYWRAVIRLDQGDVDGARSDIALAASQFPEFAGLVYAIGRVHLLSQRPTEAAVAFERYLGVNPGDANALFYAAFAANQLGNREQALEYLNRMQGVEGQSVRLLWLRAKTLLAAGEHGVAEMLLRDAVAVDEPPVQLVLVAQEALLRLGRTEAALALVQKALATRPDSRDLLAAEARLQFAVGDAESAEATGRKLFQRDPEDVDALLLLAQAAAGRGEADPVLLLRLRRAQERVPGDLRIPLLLGELNAAADDIPVACAALMDALRLDPTAAPVIRRLQQLRCAAVDPELIQEVYRELMASHPREVRALPALLAMDGGDASAAGALDRLERAVAADPDNTALRAGLVGALLRAGQPEAAQAALETLPAAQLRDPAILLAQGLVALARDDTRGAVRAFEDLVAARPADPESVLLLAEAEARDGDVPSARYHFIDSLRLAPRHPLAPAVASRLFAADTAPEARRRLVDDIRRHAPGSPLFEPLQAQILLDAGRPDEAAELYRAMHARQPDNPRLFDRLLKTLVAAGRHEQALALAEPWAERHPEAAGVALTLGDLYAEAGDDARAGDWYRRVLELTPNNLFALNNLAVILTDSDPSAAAALAERAWRQQPRQPQVLDTYGAALLALGDVARARELLSDAFSYSGGDPGIALNLARALAAGGDSERAREVLRPLLHRDFRQQAEARALMMQLGAR